MGHSNVMDVVEMPDFEREPAKKWAKKISLSVSCNRRAIRLSPAETIPASALGASQAYTNELVGRQDRYAASSDEILDRHVEVPPTAVTAQPEALPLLCGRFQCHASRS